MNKQIKFSILLLVITTLACSTGTITQPTSIPTISPTDTPLPTATRIKPLPFSSINEETLIGPLTNFRMTINNETGMAMSEFSREDVQISLAFTYYTKIWKQMYQLSGKEYMYSYVVLNSEGTAVKNGDFLALTRRDMDIPSDPSEGLYLDPLATENNSVIVWEVFFPIFKPASELKPGNYQIEILLNGQSVGNMFWRLLDSP